MVVADGVGALVVVVGDEVVAVDEVGAGAGAAVLRTRWIV